MKPLLICGNSSKPMKLNESESTSDRYILQGLFAGPFGVENRNKRIYEVDEYLKHLQYLRDDIKKGEPLLGELDHPDDRFEVKLKEASHRVLDIWYDKATNTIQGKIELLNTPNGKLAQSLVDQGIPLHISSRAAGTVNNDKTVNIQQIYTFDLVCKPGFAGAVLHRVNESSAPNKYTDDVYKFLTESEKLEAKNAAPRFGMINEDVSITEVNSDIRLREEAKNIVENNNDIIRNMKDMNNNDIAMKHCDNVLSEIAQYLPFTKNINFEYDRDNSLNFCRINKSINTVVINLDLVDRIIERYGEENANLLITREILNALNTQYSDSIVKTNQGYFERIMREAEPLRNYVNKSESLTEAEKETEDEDKKEEKDDAEKEDKDDSGVEIISVRAETSDDGVEIVSVEAEDGENGDSEDESDEKESEEEKEENDEGNESKDEGKVKTPEGEEKEMLLDCKDIEERKNNFMEELEEKMDAIKSKSEQKKADESCTIQKYPMSRLLNESNFAGFMGLKESQKSNVINYLADHGIVDIDSINENWKNGINYKQETEVWLKYAPNEYRQMFESADEQTKESIRNTASFILFENQNDVNVFWENTGLANRASYSMLNEQFVNTMPKVSATVNEEALPYGKDFINTVAQMAVAYNE